MGLTSGLFIGLVAMAAAVVNAGAVWLWPQLAGHSTGQVTGRVGVLAVTQLLTMVTLAAVMNSYFGFYASWSDLLGTDNGPARIIERSSAQQTPDEPAPQSVGAPLVRTDHVGPAFGGRLVSVQVTGVRSRLTGNALVYLPAQYYQPAFASRRLPAVVVLTGYPGTVSNLITRLHLPTHAAALTDKGQLQPTVFVMLNPTLTPPRDTECTDVPRGPQVETFLAQDLPEAIAATYRVTTRPAGWAVMGDSTGGYCAAKLAMRHPGRFTAAVSLAGSYRAHTDLTTGDLYGGSQTRRDQNDPTWLLQHLPPPPISILVTTSRFGESDLAATLLFLALVKPPMHAASLVLPSGGHNFRTWERELDPALHWLSGHLTGS